MGERGNSDSISIGNIIGVLINGICHQSDMLEMLRMLLESLELSGQADDLSEIIEDVDSVVRELEYFNSQMSKDVIRNSFDIDYDSLKEMPEFKNLMERIEQIDF